MKKFIVNTAILTPKMEPKACAANAPSMLKNAGIKDVRLLSCYCCSSEARVIFVAEAENGEKVLESLNRINVPVASIIEAEEIKSAM